MAVEQQLSLAAAIDPNHPVFKDVKGQPKVAVASSSSCVTDTPTCCSRCLPTRKRQIRRGFEVVRCDSRPRAYQRSSFDGSSKLSELDLTSAC